MRQILTIVANPELIKLDKVFLDDFNNIIKDLLLNQVTLAESKAYKYELKFLNEEIYDKIEAFLSDQKLDFFIQTKESFETQKRLFLTDMDSTLIENECIDEMARRIGKYEEISNITKSAMSGNSLFESSLEQRVSILADMSVNWLEDIYKNDIKLNPGAEIMLKTLQARGFKTGVVSGGFTYFTSHLREKLGLDYEFANVLEIKDEKLTGKIIPPIFGSEDKLIVMKDIMKKEFIHKQEIIGIGDGANDLPFLEYIDNAFAYHAKAVVKKNVPFHINYTDLTSILYFLGIKESEFVSIF